MNIYNFSIITLNYSFFLNKFIFLVLIKKKFKFCPLNAKIYKKIKKAGWGTPILPESGCACWKLKNYIYIYYKLSVNKNFSHMNISQYNPKCLEWFSVPGEHIRAVIGQS